MYFTLFGYNSVLQGISMVQDLKFVQYAKLPPRAIFSAQVTGTLIGAVVNYIMMMAITTNQRDILLSIQGTNVWSGQNIQQFTSQAIAWGVLATPRRPLRAGAHGPDPRIPTTHHLAHASPRLPDSGLRQRQHAHRAAYAGILSVGISSSMLSYFVIGFASQFWLRRWKPDWFIKYNYVLAAALDGGTQILFSSF